MKFTIPQEEKEVLEVVKYRPSISIIMPFEPKMSVKTELEYKLKLAVGRVESELMANYTSEKALPVLRRLRSVIKNLDFNTYKKSIAIFISPIFDKVYYLDIPVEEKIIVDESFEIRDLVYSKKEVHKYLVLVLSSKKTKIYLEKLLQALYLLFPMCRIMWLLTGMIFLKELEIFLTRITGEK